MKREWFLNGLLGFALPALTVVSLPHLFTHKVGSLSSLAIFTAIILSEWLWAIMPIGNSRSVRLFGFFSNSFPVLFLVGVTVFSFSALNEKLYSSSPEAHSVFNGFFSLGGHVPLSDSKAYLSAVLSFLRDGSMHSIALYRPFAHLFTAVLYRLSDSDWIMFYRLSTLLLVVSIWYHGMVFSRYAGRLAAVFGAWLLCRYFAQFQGTYLTEVTGGALGMVSLAVVFHGYSERSFRTFGFGLVLFVLAMQMRSGVVFFVPMLLLLGGIRFMGVFRWRFSSFFACIALTVLAYLLPAGQNRLLRNPIDEHSNASFYIFQVLRNSDTWETVYREYPVRTVDGIPEDFKAHLKRVNTEIKARLMNQPEVFVRNYLSMVYRYSPRLERFLLPWSNAIPTSWAWGVLLCFLVGFVIHPPGSVQRSLEWFLFFYLLCCFLGSPMLNEFKTRFFAVSVSLNTLVATVAVSNVLTGFLLLFRAMRGTGLFRLKTLPSSEVGIRGGKQSIDERIMTIWPFLLIVLVILGPLAIDRFRGSPPPKPALHGHWPEKAGTVVEVLDVKKSPYALLDPSADFKVRDPRLLPRSKWTSEWKGASLPAGRTYWLQPVVSYQERRIKTYGSLLLPESLLQGVPMDTIDTLVVRTDTALNPISKAFVSSLFDVREVLYIGLRNDN